MDAIEEHIRRPLLVRARPPSNGTDNLADARVGPQFLYAAAEPERRTGKTRHPVPSRQIKDGYSIGQRARRGLINKQRFAGLEDGYGLLQMNPPVHTFQKHHINLFQQRRDGGHNLDAHAPQLFSEHGHPVPAGRHIGASGITGHHADAGQLAAGLRAVEELGKGRNVRSVQADHACPQRLVCSLLCQGR